MSCIDTLEIVQQVFTLRNCCSAGIQERIDWPAQITINMALNSLRALFLIEYPILTRRLEYLRNSQSNSETVEEFVLRDRKMYIAADVAHLTPLHLQILKLISGVRDRKLQLELLKLPAGATLDQVDTVWHAFVANKLTSEKLFNSHNHKAQRVNNNITQCWRCGINGHISFHCEAKAKDVYCNKCKSYGIHVTSMCQERQRQRSNSHSQDRTRQNSRGRDWSRGRRDRQSDSRDSRGRTPGAER